MANEIDDVPAQDEGNFFDSIPVEEESNFFDDIPVASPEPSASSLSPVETPLSAGDVHTGLAGTSNDGSGAVFPESMPIPEGAPQTGAVFGADQGEKAPNVKGAFLDASREALSRITDAGIDLVGKGPLAVEQSIAGAARMLDVTKTVGYLMDKAGEWGGNKPGSTNYRRGLADTILDETGHDPQKAMDWWSSMYSDERVGEEAKLEAAKGVVDSLKILATEPALAAGKALESVPGMFAIMAPARIAAGKVAIEAEKLLLKKGVTDPKIIAEIVTKQANKIATRVAAAMEGGQQAGSSFNELEKDGIDETRNYIASLGSGLTTAGISLGMGSLGQKIGLGDVEAGVKAKGGALVRFLKGGTQEGLGEEGFQSPTEQAWSNWARKEKITDGLGKAWAIGTVTGFLSGGTFSVALNRADAPKTEPAVAPPTKEEAFDKLLLANSQEEAVAALDGLPREDIEWIEKNWFDQKEEGKLEVKPESIQEAINRNTGVDKGDIPEDSDMPDFSTEDIQSAKSILESDTKEDNTKELARINNELEKRGIKPAAVSAEVLEQVAEPAPESVDGQQIQEQARAKETGFTERDIEAKEAKDRFEAEKSKEKVKKEAADKILAEEKLDEVDIKDQEASIPKADRIRMKKEAQTEAKANPVYGQMKAARTAALDLKQIKKDYTKESLKDIPGHQSMFTLNGRTSPDGFAKEQGYESLDAMIEAFKAAPPQKVALDRVYKSKVQEWGKADRGMQEAEVKDKPVASNRIAEGELVNGITREAAGKMMAEGDEQVLSHIREGIDEHGVPKMEDAIRNQEISEVASVPKDQRAAVRGRIAKLRPQIDNIFDLARKAGKVAKEPAEEAGTEKAPVTETITEKESSVQGQEVNTSPSEAQIEADNYKRGHTSFDGLQVSIENPIGTTRKWTDDQGRTGEQTFKSDYGYIKGTTGFDKDHVDLFIKPGYEGGANTVYVINQTKQDGSFDEQKVIIGVDSEIEAMELYNSNYEKGWDRGKSVVAMPTAEFKEWVKSDQPQKGELTADQIPVKKETPVKQEPAEKVRPEVKRESREKTDKLLKKYAGRNDAIKNITDRSVVREEMLAGVTPENRERLKKQLEDKLLGAYGVTNFADIEDFYHELDKRGIPYSYERSDGGNMGGLNKHHKGKHFEADKDIKVVWGEYFAERALDFGAVVARDQGDEFIVVWPNYTAKEANEIRGAIDEEIRLQRDSMGLDKITHGKLDLPNYGALHINYGILENKDFKHDKTGKMKYGEMDTATDELQNLQKKAEQVDIAEREGYHKVEGGEKYVRREIQQEARPPRERQRSAAVEEDVEVEEQAGKGRGEEVTAESREAERLETEPTTEEEPAEQRPAEPEISPTTKTGKKKSPKAIAAQKKKAATLPGVKAEPDQTEDVGKELVYNKRNWVSKGLDWSDIKDKDVALRVKQVTKAKVYPRPDYQSMIDSGMQPVVAHIIKQAYDSLSAKPKVYGVPSDEQLEQYIKAVNNFMDGVLKWASNKEEVLDWVNKISKSARVQAGVTAGRPTSIIDMMRKEPPAGKGLLESVFPGGWRAHNSDLSIIGGNKTLQAIQPHTGESVKALKDIAKGWPKPQEAWSKRGFKIVPADNLRTDTYSGEASNGRKYTYVHVYQGSDRILSHSIDGAESKSDPKVVTFIDEITSELKDKFLLVDKRNNFINSFSDKEKAVEGAREHVKPGKKKKKVSEKGISVVAAQRKGPPIRKENEDISNQKLMDTFKFKGINFGNWMKGKSNEKERQLHINHAYDSFHDLSQLLNVPPEAMSLNGLIGVAFGAQGKGGAAAHFVSGFNEINLTRESGAGSLAHEWAHALDHHFGRQAGLERDTEPFLSSSLPYQTRRHKDSQIRENIVDKFQAIVKAMTKRDKTAKEIKADNEAYEKRVERNVDSWLQGIESRYLSQASKDLTVKIDGKDVSFVDTVKNTVKRIKKGDYGDGKVTVRKGRTSYEMDTSFHPVVLELRDLHKKAFGRVYPIADFKSLQSNIDSLVYRKENKKQDSDHIPQVSTDYLKSAMSLDKETGKKQGGKGYWSQNLEMFARAFDAYVSDTLESKEIKNTYLSHFGKVDETVPKDKERKKINKAFDELIAEIKYRKTTEGGIELYDITSVPMLASRELKKAVTAVGESKTYDQAKENLLKISSHIYEIGMDFKTFSQEMASTIGDAWQRFKDKASELWDYTRKLLAEERGSIGDKEVSPPVKESEKKGNEIIDKIITSMKKHGRFDKELVKSRVKKYETKIADLKKIAKDNNLDVTEKQKQVRDVLGDLPMHVRGRAINEIVKIGEFKTESGRERAVDRAMGRIVTLLDQYYVSEGRKEIDSLLKKAKNSVKKRHGVTRSRTTPETLKQLEDITEVKNMTTEELGARLDEIIPDEKTTEPTDEQVAEMALLNTYGDLRNKTSEEIANAIGHLNTVIDTGKFLWQQQIEEERARRKALGDKAVEVIGAGKPLLETHERGLTKNFITDGMRAYSDKSQSWQFLMEKLSRFEKGTRTLQGGLKYFVYMVHGAAHKETTGVLEQNKKIQAKLKEIYGKSMMRISWTVAKNAADVKNTGINLYGEDGNVLFKNIKTSQNKAYKKWMEWQDETLRDDLIRQGVTQDTINEIEKFMKPEVKKWAEWQLEEFYPGYYQSINDVFSALTYTDMPNSPNYSPTRRDYKKGSDQEMTLDGSASYHASMIKGANKRRVKNNLNLSWEKGDGDSILSQHVAEMEHFKAWALVVRDLRSVFGRQDIGEVISDHHGDTMKGVINDFVERFVRGGIEARNNIATLDKIRSTFTTLVLALNNVVFLKQLTSIPAYAMSIPVKDFMVGFSLALTNPMKAFKTLSESEMMKTRYSLSRMERDMSLAARRTPAKQFTGKKTLSDKAMIMTKLGDKMAIILGGYSVYRYHYKKQLKKHGDKELAKKEALVEFDIISESAQQASGQKDLSVYQTGGSLQKGFTMFMTTPASYARYEEAALRNLLSGKGKVAENLKIIAITHLLLPTVFQLVASGGEWDEEKMKRAWALGPLNGLFIWRDILGGIADQFFLGKAWGFSAQPHLDALYDIVTGIADRGFALKDITSLVAATRTFAGMVAAVSGETEHPIRRSIGYSESALEPIETSYKKYNHEFNQDLREWKADRTNPRPNMKLKGLKKGIAKARSEKNREAELKLKKKFIDIAKKR